MRNGRKRKRKRNCRKSLECNPYHVVLVFSERKDATESSVLTLRYMLKDLEKRRQTKNERIKTND